MNTLMAKEINEETVEKFLKLGKADDKGLIDYKVFAHTLTSEPAPPQEVPKKTGPPPSENEDQIKEVIKSVEMDLS